MADVKAQFASVLDDVVHQGARFVIERHGRAVAALVGLDDLDRLEPSQSHHRGGAVALIGLWEELVAVDEGESPSDRGRPTAADGREGARAGG